MTSPASALRAVEDLAEFLASGHELPDESRQILRDGLQACVDSQFETCLFTAIGLKSRGGISLERHRRKANRDALLVELWQTGEDYRGLPPAAASKLMASQFRRYHGTRWHRDRNGAPPTLEPLSTWWKILKEGERVPDSRRLQQILEREIQSYEEARSD